MARVYTGRNVDKLAVVAVGLMFADVQASYLRTLFVAALLVAMLSTDAARGPASASQSTIPAQKARIIENYGGVPLSFEPNRGQAQKGVKFLSRGRSHELYLGLNEAALVLCRPVFGLDRADDHERKRHPLSESAACQVLRLEVAGASGEAEPTGEEQLPGTANYFIGRDPAQWRVSVPTYARVRYAGIYPGIDLVYYGTHRQLEFDFVVAPHADPRLIRLRMNGANRLHLAADGELVVITANGALAFHKPSIYQMVGGHRHPVAGDFVLLGKRTVGFRLGSYDRAQALVIDPVLAYSTFLGDGDEGKAIAVDTAGDVYVTGQTCSFDFPVTPGAFQSTNHAPTNPGCTAFVTKLDQTATALVYSTYLGGSGGDSGNAIAVDTAGNAYVAGQTFSTDFPVTPGAIQTTNHAAANNNSNAFVTKLNPTGSALVYSTYLGGSGLSAQTVPGTDEANAMAVDAAGNAYVTGRTFSSDFPVTAGAFQTTNHAAASDFSNAFLAKLNPAGTALVYSTYLGGSGQLKFLAGGDVGNAIAVDASGEAYVSGQTFSADFPVTPGAYQTTNRATAIESSNAFVTELDPAGTALVYSTYLGGSGNILGDLGSAIAVDPAGNVYVSGRTGSSDFPVTQGAYQTTSHGAANNVSNAFISKLNPAGTALLYSTYLGGTGGIINLTPTLGMSAGDQASGLAIDGSDNAYVTGSTASADFPVTQDAYQATNHDQTGCVGGCIGGYNAFVTKLNSAGSALVYSTYLGGRGYNPRDFLGVLSFGEGDQASALAVDASGNVYVTGGANSYDFPVSAGAFQATFNSGSGGAFVAKLNMGATSTATTPTVTVTPASSTISSAMPLAVTVSVSGGSSSPEPTGTVWLASDGTYSSGAIALSGGSATIDIPAGSLLAEPAEYPGPDGLIAKYVPDTASSSVYNFSSGVARVTVVGADFSVTPSLTALTWAQSQSQALPVAIAAFVVNGAPVPTGTVTLTTGSYSSGATALSAGSAAITIPPATLTAGFNTLNLSYSGDSNYAPVAVAGSALVTVGTPNASFTIAGTPVTLTAGATTGNTSTITVTPAGGFTGSVVLTAAVTSSPNGAQDLPTLSFGSTSPVNITGPAGGTATLTISTTTPGGCAQSSQSGSGVLLYSGSAVLLACLLLMAMPASRRRQRTALVAVALLIVLSLGVQACGGGSSPPCTVIPGTTPGTYTLTVTGTSGATATTGTVTLTVQ